MATYDNNLILKDALQLYFSKYHFADGGYNLKWFKIKVGPFYISLPNTRDRIAAVKIHDIHHIVTEYTADLRGEAEIGGWEIASGCSKYYVAWILNFGSFFYGLVFFPTALFRAFLNGRKTKSNFYYNTIYDDVLLNKTVGELRNLTIYNSARANSIFDYISFGLYTLLVLTLAFSFFLGIFCLVNMIF